MTLYTAGTDVDVFYLYNHKSSAYKLTLWVALEVVIPGICASWRMTAARGANSANKSGQGGPPCLVPQFSLKRCEVIPLVITDTVGEL